MNQFLDILNLPIIGIDVVLKIIILELRFYGIEWALIETKSKTNFNQRNKTFLRHAYPLYY